MIEQRQLIRINSNCILMETYFLSYLDELRNLNFS